MAKKIYVGNMSYSTTEEALEELFSQYGTVMSVKIIYDRITNRHKGFGFIEMENDDEAGAAIAELNGQDVMGRELKVNEAIEKQDRRRF